MIIFLYDVATHIGVTEKVRDGYRTIDQGAGGVGVAAASSEDTLFISAQILMVGMFTSSSGMIIMLCYLACLFRENKFLKFDETIKSQHQNLLKTQKRRLNKKKMSKAMLKMQEDSLSRANKVNLAYLVF